MMKTANGKRDKQKITINQDRKWSRDDFERDFDTNTILLTKLRNQCLSLENSFAFLDMSSILEELWNTLNLACVASVSVRFRNKERGTRVKDRATNGTSKRTGRGWGRTFGFRFISRSVKTEIPLPRSFFAPKPNGNACFAGHFKPSLRGRR